MYITTSQYEIKGDELIIKVKLDSPWFEKNHATRKIGIYIDDDCSITDIQRRKIYALIGDIALWEGYSVEDALQQLKLRFLIHNDSSDWFSLSKRSSIAISKENASKFIVYLMNHCLENDIPLKRPLYKMVDDVDAYLYACLRYKRCACCGKKPDLHHWDSIGMGRDREQVVHVGMSAIALCREHHNEAHNIGKQSFYNKYKLYGIKIDHTIAKLYNLKRSVEK